MDIWKRAAAKALACIGRQPAEDVQDLLLAGNDGEEWVGCR